MSVMRKHSWHKVATSRAACPSVFFLYMEFLRETKKTRDAGAEQTQGGLSHPSEDQ